MQINAGIILVFRVVWARLTSLCRSCVRISSDSSFSLKIIYENSPIDPIMHREQAILRPLESNPRHSCRSFQMRVGFSLSGTQRRIRRHGEIYEREVIQGNEGLGSGEVLDDNFLMMAVDASAMSMRSLR